MIESVVDTHTHYAHKRFDSGRDEMIDILQGYKLMDWLGAIHCFSGNREQAEKLIDMGFYIGVNRIFSKKDMNVEVRVVLLYYIFIFKRIYTNRVALFYGRRRKTSSVLLFGLL